MSERPRIPGPEYRAMKEAHEAQAYRQALAGALRFVRSHDGTEASHETVLKELIAFENTVKGLKISTTETLKAQEELAAKRFHPHAKGGRDIDALLEMAITSEGKKQAVRRSLEETEKPVGKEKQQTPLSIRRIEGSILPPDSEKGGPIPGNEAGEFEPVRFEPRLLELLELLERNEVYMDDCLVTIGTLLPSQMREASYAAVEIPRIDRTVLICDQVGEATFVIRGGGDPKQFLTLTKDDLLASYGNNVKRVIRHNPVQWHGDLGSLLFGEEAWVSKGAFGKTSEQGSSSKSKVDVHKYADLRDAILASEFGTPEKWAEMGPLKRSEYSVVGHGITALSRIFGVTDKEQARMSVPFFELGIKIFGSNATLLERLDDAKKRRETRGVSMNELRRMVVESPYGTPEKWAEMPVKVRDHFRIGGLGLKAIATKLNIEGKSPYVVFYKVGLSIFGPNEMLQHKIDEAMEYQEGDKTPVDELRRLIYASAYGTPEKWAMVPFSERRKIKIRGLGVDRLARKFGVGGLARNYPAGYFELGLKIFGEHAILREKFEQEKRLLTVREASADELARLIKETDYGTPEKWAAMQGAARKRFTIHGVGLVGVANKFGVIGDPTSTQISFFELGLKIFGTNDMLREKLHKAKEKDAAQGTPLEKLRLAIEESAFGSASKWVTMTLKDRHDFRVFGLGLTTLATKFGITGNVLSRTVPFLEFGLKIFGPDPLLIEKLDEARNQQKIRKARTKKGNGEADV